MLLSKITKNSNVLYHGISADRSVIQLFENEIKGFTHQRYWADGRRRKDNEQDYESSYILKGISTTRDIEYAKKWRNSVIYILDRDAIRKNYKVIPYSWGYSIPKSTTPGMGNTISEAFRHKREREEFVVLGRIEKSFPELKNEWENLFDGSDSEPEEFIPLDEYMFAPKGRLPLKNVLKGILITKRNHPSYLEKHIEEVKKHPLFLGEV